jgi:hypothetical protein
MIVVIFKNTLLILLIVLIVHFMIKNRIVDDLDTFKRKLVHDDTLNETNIKQPPPRLNVNVDEENIKPNGTKTVRFAENEYVPECPNSLTCDDFKVSEESGMSNEDNMKELYDFVYDEESNKSTIEHTLQDFFPEDKPLETQVDKTEIDTHHAKKSMETVNTSCNFEVIGMIEVNGEDDVFGLDTLSSTNFSNI